MRPGQQRSVHAAAATLSGGDMVSTLMTAHHPISHVMDGAIRREQNAASQATMSADIPSPVALDPDAAALDALLAPPHAATAAAYVYSHDSVMLADHACWKIEVPRLRC